MKKLTRKFKQEFKNYEYNNQDIDILLSLLDIILEMMCIIELCDHENIKKLSSFTRLLSSDYSKTILDSSMIEETYNNTILPILDTFDEKYTSKFVSIGTKEIINGVQHTEVYTDKRVLLASEDFCNGNIDIDTYRKFLREESLRYKNENNTENLSSSDILNIIERSPWNNTINKDITQLNKFIISNKDTNDPDILQTIFNMSKDTISILHNIYDVFTNGKSQEHNEKYIRDLISLRDTMEIISNYDNSQIQLLSDVIRSLCYSLIYELNHNNTTPPSSIMMIELKFKSLEGIKYNQYIQKDSENFNKLN